LDKVNTLLNHAPLLKAIREGKGWKEIEALWQTETAAFTERRPRVLMY